MVSVSGPSGARRDKRTRGVKKPGVRGERGLSRSEELDVVGSPAPGNWSSGTGTTPSFGQYNNGVGRYAEALARDEPVPEPVVARSATQRPAPRVGQWPPPWPGPMARPFMKPAVDLGAFAD